MLMCIVCGEREGEVFFGIFEAPIEGTGEDVLVESAEESDIGFAVFEWTGESEEYEYWECCECYRDTTYCLVCNSLETCVCEVHNEEALPPAEWPKRLLRDVFDNDS